jgi:MtN3 and saliva related transmembrane protein
VAPSDIAAAIGAVAGTLTTLSFVPQVVKSWRRRSVGDLSATMLLVFTSGIVLWIVYGVAIGDWPLIGANVVTLGLALALVAMKLKFR